MMARSVEEVLGAIKVPVRSVAICLAADLQAEHDELTERLDRLRKESLAKMGDGAEMRDVAEHITALEAQMRESEVVFKFRGLSKNALKRIQDKFPPPEDNPRGLAWDVDAGASTLLAESAIEPTMSVDQAERLLDSVTDGQADRLMGAAWLASTGSTQVPFSVRASELTNGSD
jgi:small-conductance mechanosensitive channel